MTKKKKSKGLGDTIEKVTKKTGIKKAVELFTKATGIDCGCEERKEKLNKMFSYGKQPNCMSKDEYEEWKSYNAVKTNTLQPDQRKIVTKLHASLFNHKEVVPCTCNPKQWMQFIEGIDKVYSTYER